MSNQPRVEVEWEGHKVSGQIRTAVADALLVGAEFILTESNNATPLDEGTLVNSGAATVDEGKLKAAVSYNTPYAVRQHEDLTARHAPGRPAKFLELAAARNRDKTGRLIAKETRQRVAAISNAKDPT